MEEKLFDELVQSIKEMGEWLRGGDAPGRITFVGEPDPRLVRARLGLTHEEFAAALCIDLETLRRWEQGHRDPFGPAMRLLRIADKHPAIFLEPYAS